MTWSPESDIRIRMDAAAVGIRIRRARLAAGFDRGSKFADEIDVRAHTLWRYEDGRMVPGTEILLRIAKATAVSMEWLLTGSGDGPRATKLEATGS